MTFFSDSYEQARDKFLRAAHKADASVRTTNLEGDLVVDFSVSGDSGKPTLIVTSGLHGVEGFFGSAVQLSLLAQLQRSKRLRDIRIVLVHGLNPYGFKHIRRFDQSNIDLNRNFLKPDELYCGAPAGYKKLNSFLNPDYSPSLFEPYRIKAMLNIMRYGVPALKEAIVSGQYEHPDGIFFGGKSSAVSAEFVKAHCETWVDGSDRVAHIDLHSGLGKFGSYKLLINEVSESEDYPWYTNAFDPNSVSTIQSSDDIAYAITGSMGAWLKHRFRDRKYYFAGLEFGTYGPIRVLGAIRTENCAHHYADVSSRRYAAAKAELLECFCPRSDAWRNAVVDQSMKIISSAVDGLCFRQNIDTVEAE